MRDRIPVNLAAVPYRANVVLGTEAFAVEVHYNSRLDGYVVHLYRGGALVCGGEPVVYGRPLWADVYEPGLYPALRIVPLDESGTADAATKATFGKLVFLTIDDDNLVVGAADE